MEAKDYPLVRSCILVQEGDRYGVLVSATKLKLELDSDYNFVGTSNSDIELDISTAERVDNIQKHYEDCNGITSKNRSTFQI